MVSDGTESALFLRDSEVLSVGSLLLGVAQKASTSLILILVGLRRNNT